VARLSKRIEINESSKTSLQNTQRTDKRHCIRQRCQMILLKTEGYSSYEIGKIVGSCEASVNSWVRRYEKSGIEGLYTKSGRGRKAILQQGHTAIIRSAVTQERQRLSQAKAIIEKELNKEFSQKTLTRFLKVITAVTSE